MQKKYYFQLSLDIDIEVKTCHTSPPLTDVLISCHYINPNKRVDLVRCRHHQCDHLINMQLVLAMIQLMNRSLSSKQQSLTHYHTSSFSYSTLVNQCLYEGSRLIYVICVCLRIVVSNTQCVVFLIYLSSSCVPYVSSFSGLSIF